MSKPGWLSIRNLPFLKDSNAVSNVYYRELKNFFKIYTLCSSCDGRGYRMVDEEKFTKGGGVCSIRFQGIPELEELNDMEDVVTAEVIRGILERKLWGKKPCVKCSGSRFVRRDGTKLRQAG